jgi:hypothetical protein
MDPTHEIRGHVTPLAFAPSNFRHSTSVHLLKRAKPGAWACIQAREVWSTEEEANMRPGHFWICKLGTVPGSMSCVEQKFDLQGSKCKWKEYKGTRYSHGDSTLVATAAGCCTCIRWLCSVQHERGAHVVSRASDTCREEPEGAAAGVGRRLSPQPEHQVQQPAAAAGPADARTRTLTADVR